MCVDQKSYPLVLYLSVCVDGYVELHHVPLGTLLSCTAVALYADAIFLRLAIFAKELALTSCQTISHGSEMVEAAL